MDHTTLEKLFLLQLRDIYSGERQVIEFIPKIIKIVSNKDLRVVLREHLEITKVQASRIEEIFKLKSSHPAGENCNVVEGMIDEVEELIEETENSDMIDVILIGNTQKIKHYEIASYSSVITYAKGLGDEKASELLQFSLDEEYEMDNKLDKLAEEIIQIYAKVNS